MFQRALVSKKALFCAAGFCTAHLSSGGLQGVRTTSPVGWKRSKSQHSHRASQQIPSPLQALGQMLRG